MCINFNVLQRSLIQESSDNDNSEIEQRVRPPSSVMWNFQMDADHWRCYIRSSVTKINTRKRCFSVRFNEWKPLVVYFFYIGINIDFCTEKYLYKNGMCFFKCIFFFIKFQELLSMSWKIIEKKIQNYAYLSEITMYNNLPNKTGISTCTIYKSKCYFTFFFFLIQK